MLIELAAFPEVDDLHVATTDLRLSERGSGINAHGTAGWHVRRKDRDMPDRSQ